MCSVIQSPVVQQLFKGFLFRLLTSRDPSCLSPGFTVFLSAFHNGACRLFRVEECWVEEKERPALLQCSMPQSAYAHVHVLLLGKWTRSDDFNDISGAFSLIQEKNITCIKKLIFILNFCWEKSDLQRLTLAIHVQSNLVGWPYCNHAFEQIVGAYEIIRLPFVLF